MKAIGERVRQAIGARIRQARKTLRYSQEDVAKKLDVTRQAVSSWETGASLPDASQLAILAPMLNVTSDWIVGISKFGGPESEEREVIARAMDAGPEALTSSFVARWNKEMDRMLRKMEEDYQEQRGLGKG